MIDVECIKHVLSPIMGLKSSPDMTLPQAFTYAVEHCPTLRQKLDDEGLDNLDLILRAATSAASKMVGRPGEVITNADDIAAIHAWSQQSPLFPSMTVALRSAD